MDVIVNSALLKLSYGSNTGIGLNSFFIQIQS